MFIEVIERRSPITNRKSIVYIFKCDTCGATLEASAHRFKRNTKRHFCNTKCAGLHRSRHPEEWPDTSAARNSPKATAKATATKRRKWASGEMVHPWVGRHHSEETKKHLSEVSKGGIRSGENNGMYGRNHTEEAKAKMSEKKSQLIVDGKFKPYGIRNKKGWYESIKSGKSYYFKSGWEERVMKYLDNNENVVEWQYECIRISYYYDNHKRWYVPDFLIKFSTSETKELWEVKPSQFLNTERVKNTIKAGMDYCEKENMIFKVITEVGMKEFD